MSLGSSTSSFATGNNHSKTKVDKIFCIKFTQKENDFPSVFACIVDLSLKQNEATGWTDSVTKTGKNNNGFSTLRFNFRGVGKSDGEFDNGQGELADAAAALEWIERENQDFSQCWVSGFSFGSLICMQLIMRRPEVNKFIAISPQPNVYDFTFLAPGPISGMIIYGKNDELVPEESLLNLKKRLNMQKNIDVKFNTILNANHFYSNKEKELSSIIESYLKEKITVF